MHLFPFGVSFERFDAVRRERRSAARRFRGAAAPVVGYVGGLHQWVDQDLLAAVAARMPDVTFALVGPAQTDVSTLERCPNVHLLGQRPHADVPRYVKAFDVGIVPYRLTEYTANVYPTKLNEYLVMGIPVVATDLPEIRRFNARSRRRRAQSRATPRRSRPRSAQSLAERRRRSRRRGGLPSRRQTAGRAGSPR